jgi:hypothetical protein
VVTVEIGDCEAAGGIGLKNGLQREQDGVVMTVGHEGRCAVANVARDCVEKRDPLNVKEIGAKRNIEVVLQHWRG